ncbi:hypothetical protein GJ744_004055 [Endocarpon pusillum]|uniref:Carrier domain-containing protein n=1 Tax=Endocarpon pusillum TaxID=364733 RepID=A0A8H7A8C2_9EURO|nr:hypothetical protein GJ744_004055 [Endocarpon pusillum]
MVPTEQQLCNPPVIVGIGLRLPGGCHDGKSYWDLLVGKEDARRPIPPERFNIDGFHSGIKEAGSLSMKHGYFLEEPVDRFDAAFFNMSQAEIPRVDPQQRLLLEVIYEALENAGETQWNGKDIAVYTASFGQDWLRMQAKDTQDGSVYDVTGADDFVLANRVSYEFDLRGPSMTVKTGCSSGLVALHLACEALDRGDCSAALVGASNLLLSPEYFMSLDNLGALSANGSSNTFDARADGYARADAVNAVYVKRLNDALRDGNPVRAIIRSTAINADGKTKGLTNPNPEAQAALIRRAYEKAGIVNPGDTPVVECHGTGTMTGDPLEVSAVAKVFGNKGTYLGSVKPNIGHGEGAAGLSSLIKGVLALERQTIPPNIKFRTQNPKIRFSKSNLIVPVTATPWPRSRDRRISINSFGLGGANAHVILEANPATSTSNGVATTNGHKCPIHRLLAFSAHTEASLNKLTSRYEDLVKSGSVELSDLAYTLGARRLHRNFRSFCVTDGTTYTPVPPYTSADFKGLLFIFTGQGAQWAGMGRDLIQNFPSFKKDVQQMDCWLSQAKQAPSWSIEDVLIHSLSVNTAEYSQPICTAVQIALVNLLRCWNMRPAGVVGHSSGEIAAAYAVGAIGMKDAILVAFYRGVTSKLQTRPGAMAAVGLGRHEVTEFLNNKVTIACENSFSSVTISGDQDAVEEAIVRVRKNRPNVLVSKLHVDKAYHSDHMNTVGAEYEGLIAAIETGPRVLECPMFSSVTGKAIHDAAFLGPSYWRSNMEKPVLFLSAVQMALNSDHRFSAALEVGPHSALAGPFRQISREINHPIVYTNCLRRDFHGTTTLLTALGQLYTLGLVPDFAAMNSDGHTLSSLAAYPWTHDTPYWHESRISREFRTRRHPERQLLGSRALGSNDLEPSWRKFLNLKDVPWLRDHTVAGEIVFPAAGYITMAGEAINQHTDTTSFTLRSVSIESALVLHNGKSTEIVTRLQPLRLTTNSDSAWHEFAILSHDGRKWTRHCSGEVCGGNASTASLLQTTVRSGIIADRKISTSKWYQATRNAGLEYGPEFQGLQNPVYDVAQSIVSASVAQKSYSRESYSALHPTSLDQLLQCGILASVKGHLRLLKNLVLPTYVDEMFVGSAKDFQPLQFRTAVTAAHVDFVAVDGRVAARDGSLVLAAKGIQFRILNNGFAPAAHNPMRELRQLEWRPDIDLIDPNSLIHLTTDLTACLELVERLNILCVIETTRKLSDKESPSVHHLQQFREWNRKFVANIQRNGSKVVPQTDCLFKMSPEDRQRLITKLTIEAAKTPAAPIALAVTRIFDAVGDIFQGIAEPLAILLKDHLLVEVYNFFNMLDHRKFFQLLGHSDRSMRILEVGAGTGGFTSTILSALTESGRESSFSNYTYTDISSGFFKAAKERFREYAGMEQAVLDISQDPAATGLRLHSYDLVIAANVLHATPDLLKTLKNCRALLRPGGRLFMLELCSEAKWVNYIMGTLSGWWLGQADGRLDEPYLNAEQWNTLLRKAGFTGVNAAVADQVAPFQLNNIIISQAIEQDIPRRKDLTLLVNDAETLSERARELKIRFESAGYQVCISSLEHPHVSPMDIVSLLDVDSQKPFFQDLSEENFSCLIRLIKRFHEAGNRILWITGSAQVSAQNPYYGMILGFARTIRLELGSLFATIEIDTINNKSFSWDPVVQVFEKIQREWTKGLDHEYALLDGRVYVPRFVTNDINEMLCSSLHSSQHITQHLEITKPGLVSTLRWASKSLDAHLRDSELDIDVRCASVNYRDSFIAAGSDNGDFKVGDRVLCWFPGSLATHVRVDAQWCVKLPGDLSWEEAVSLPTNFATMIRGLMEIANLARGETILIHSAAHPMGLAAFQIAQMIGAEIFVTAASSEEVDFLTTQQGIQESRIFSSLDGSFVAAIMHATRYRGVDVVVNSLAGELLHDSLNCVAPGGNMIELGAKDITGYGKLDLSLFSNNRGLHAIDVASLFSQKASLCRRLLQTTMQLYTSGSIKPITPTASFSPKDVRQAFQLIQSNKAMGTIIVDFSENAPPMPHNFSSDQVRLRKDRAYLLVGGLGGLGRSTAVWLAERGAGCIIFLSRSARSSTANDSIIQDVEASGCEVQLFAGSVTDAAIVENVVANAAKPIAGVVHLGLVLRDEAILDMSFDNWAEATEGKVQGTWNIHNAIMHQPVEFFVLLSSVYGVQGNPKQANYASASTFLDAFVQYRQYLRLPASVIDLGVVEDIGYVSEHPTLLQNLRRAGAQLVSENDFLESLHLSIRSSCLRPTPPPTITSPYVNPAQFVVGLGQHPPDARGTGLKALESGGPSESTLKSIKEENPDDLQQFMVKAKHDSASLDDEAAVAEFIAVKVAGCMKTLLIFTETSDFNLNKGLSDAGVDSLIAIELQNWVAQTFETNLPILELTACASLLELGRLIRSRMLKRLLRTT